MTAKKKKKTKDKIFNDRERKIFRNYIGRSEVAFGAFFVAFTAFMTWWFFAQKENFDPNERDISMDVLIAQQVEDNLYKAPLQRWVNPAEAAVTGVAAAPELGPIPAEMLSNGWVDSSRLQEFTWDTLYEKIDGAEAQYKSYGFEHAWFLGLANEANAWDMNIEMYDMGTFTNALGIYSAQRGEDTNVETLGKAYYYETEIGAIGMVENYYFKLAGSAPERGMVDHALLFIEKFEPTVEPSADRPAFFTKLQEEYGFEAIGYTKEDAFQYEFCKNFWFAKPELAADARVFVHQAESDAAASELFDQFAEEQSYEYEELSRDGNRIVFKHEFLDTFFVLIQAGPMIYGIEGAESAEAATAMLTKLEALL